MARGFSSTFSYLRRNKTVFNLFVLLVLCLFAAGCSYDDVFGSEAVPEPVGIGRDRNDLKRSPCACLEIKQDYSEWQKG